VWARVRTRAEGLRATLVERGFAVTPGDSGIVSVAADDGAAISAALEEGGVHCSYVDGHIRISPHYWTVDEEITQLLKLLSH